MQENTTIASPKTSNDNLFFMQLQEYVHFVCKLSLAACLHKRTRECIFSSDIFYSLLSCPILPLLYIIFYYTVFSLFLQSLSFRFLLHFLLSCPLLLQCLLPCPLLSLFSYRQVGPSEGDDDHRLQLRQGRGDHGDLRHVQVRNHQKQRVDECNLLIDGARTAYP